jgi:uncharacterized RDD family membrane protein YckC
MSESSSDTWYFERDNQQHGPISYGELRRMASSGELNPTQLVWTPGQTDWAPASTIGGLFAVSAPLVVEPIAPPYPDPSVLPSGPFPVSNEPATIGYYAPAPGFVLYAGFWLRFLAFILDWIITTVGSAIVVGIVGGALGLGIWSAGASSQGIPEFAYFIGRLLGTATTWLYYALMESSTHQATLGKMAVGIRVTDLENNRISFGRATGRYFSKFISLIIACAGFIMAGFTDRKQGLHDIIASTLVVRK